MKSFTFALVLSLLLPAVASAHGLKLKVQQTSLIVTVTATFDGGDPADDCVVTINAADGMVVSMGSTDKTGRVELPTPPPGEYAVVADAGAGHVTKSGLTVPVQKVRDVADCTEPESEYRRPFGLAAGLAVILVGTMIFTRRARRP